MTTTLSTACRRLRSAPRALVPLLLFALVAIAAHAQPVTLRIIAPNGGENLVVGTTTHIRWLSTGLTASILVEYSADSGAVWHVIDSAAAVSGIDSMAWVVPNDTTHRALVRLTSGSRTSRSQRVFNIVLIPPPVLRVIYPNGGELFQYDSTIRIRWNADNVTGMLRIYYSVDSAKTWKFIDSVAAHQGNDSLGWTVPHDSTTKAFVRVVSAADTSVRDASNRTFIIRSVVKPSLTLYTPNGGEEFAADSVTRIRWIGADLTGQVVADYSTDNGVTWKSAGVRNARTGPDSLSWKVPNEPTTMALMRIRNGTAIDTSNATFTILGVAPADPKLRLDYPNGGEQFVIDSVIHIRWFAQDLTGRLVVEWSNNNGRAWGLVDSVNARNGNDSLTWSVPRLTTDSARIRIRWSGQPLADTSNAMFSIMPKTSGVAMDAAAAGGAVVLRGCFPNPATVSTRVAWFQRDAARVMLRLADERGTVVATVDAGARTSGEQAIDVSTAALPSGRYLYEVTTGAVRASGTFVIVR